jgi:hypothetical protein
MYLPSGSPLLQDQRDNAAIKLACSANRRNAAAQISVDGRVALFETLMSPADLALTFGPGLGVDAQLLQANSAAARATILTGTPLSTPGASATVQQIADSLMGTAGAAPTAQQVVDSAPQVFSLNGQPSQVNGCVWALPPQRTLGPPPVPTMPLAAPAVFQTAIGPASFPPPISPNVPIWTNLCWALRNGAVDASQFDPAEFQALQYRCMQLGYTGACAPPPNTLAYLSAGRRAGSLPHIHVTEDVLNALPSAPDMTGIGCPESYRMAGLTGYAPSWSDALVTSQASVTGSSDTGVGAWISDHPWLALLIAGAGAVVMSRRGR